MPSWCVQGQLSSLTFVTLSLYCHQPSRLLNKTPARQAMHASYKCNIWARSPNHCCRGKQYALHILSVCFSLSYPERKSPVFCAVLYCYLWPALLCHILYIMSYRALLFAKKITVYKMRILISYTTPPSATFLILIRIQTDIIINVSMSSYNVPVISVRFE